MSKNELADSTQNAREHRQSRENPYPSQTPTLDSKDETNTKAEKANIKLIWNTCKPVKDLITDANNSDDNKKVAIESLCVAVRKALEVANSSTSSAYSQFSIYFKCVARVLDEPNVNYSTAVHLIKGLSSILIAIEQDNRPDLSAIKYLNSLDLIDSISTFLYSKYESGYNYDNKDTPDIRYEKKKKIYSALCSIIESLANITKNLTIQVDERGAYSLQRVLKAVKIQFNDILYSTNSDYGQEHLQEFFTNVLTKLPTWIALGTIAHILLSEEETELKIYYYINNYSSENI